MILGVRGPGYNSGMPICIYATVTEPDAPAAVNYRVVITDLGAADAAVLECRTTDALGDAVWARVASRLECGSRDRILRTAIRRLVSDPPKVTSEGSRISIDLGTL